MWQEQDATMASWIADTVAPDYIGGQDPYVLGLHE